MVGNLTTDAKFMGDSVSPVTLSNDWSRLARLLLLASLSTIGSVGNVFMISAVMIEDYLRKRGNTFVVSVALADLLVTGLVIPASAIVILAGIQDNNISVCRFQWFLSALCFLVTVLSILAIAAENYLRLCCPVTTYELLNQSRITIILLAIWILSATTSGLQFTPNLSFDYCTRRNNGMIPYQIAVCIILVFIPISLTSFGYIRIRYHVRSTKTRASFKPPVTYNWDYSLMRTNLYSFLTFLLFWTPFGITLGAATVKTIPDSLFYNLAWLAISKSCINSILYCILNRHFRSAYINLFNYCCCKTTVTFSRRQRPEGVRPSGDVRVHIIPGYNMYCSPQRCRDGQMKRCSTRPTCRDIYEL